MSLNTASIHVWALIASSQELSDGVKAIVFTRSIVFGHRILLFPEKEAKSVALRGFKYLTPISAKRTNAFASFLEKKNKNQR
jgi:hypothetical protein